MRLLMSPEQLGNRFILSWHLLALEITGTDPQEAIITAVSMLLWKEKLKAYFNSSWQSCGNWPLTEAVNELRNKQPGPRCHLLLCCPYYPSSACCLLQQDLRANASPASSPKVAEFSADLQSQVSQVSCWLCIFCKRPSFCNLKDFLSNFLFCFCTTPDHAHGFSWVCT